MDETHNTLKFAARAKKIKTNATINEVLDDKTLLRAYKIEIQNLKARLALMESQPTPPLVQNAHLRGSMDSGTHSSDVVEEDVDSDIESEGLILQVRSH